MKRDELMHELFETIRCAMNQIRFDCQNADSAAITFANVHSVYIKNMMKELNEYVDKSEEEEEEEGSQIDIDGVRGKELIRNVYFTANRSVMSKDCLLGNLNRYTDSRVISETILFDAVSSGLLTNVGGNKYMFNEEMYNN